MGIWVYDISYMTCHETRVDDEVGSREYRGRQVPYITLLYGHGVTSHMGGRYDMYHTVHT